MNKNKVVIEPSRLGFELARTSRATKFDDDSDDFSAVGHETTNKTGYCDVAYRGDDIYILSGVTSTGMSVFKVE